MKREMAVDRRYLLPTLNAWTVAKILAAVLTVIAWTRP